MLIDPESNCEHPGCEKPATYLFEYLPEDADCDIKRYRIVCQCDDHASPQARWSLAERKREIAKGEFWKGHELQSIEAAAHAHAQPTKCEVTDCRRPANGHYRWGDIPQQQAKLCEICAIQLWSISPPHVKDRTVCTPLSSEEVAHA